MKEKEVERVYYSSTEVAAMLQVAVATLIKYVHSYKIPVKVLSSKNKLRFTNQNVDRLRVIVEVHKALRYKKVSKRELIHG